MTLPTVREQADAYRTLIASTGRTAGGPDAELRRMLTSLRDIRLDLVVDKYDRKLALEEVLDAASDFVKMLRGDE